MLIKNEIPILEYDDAQSAVINPDHEQLNLKLPERAVFTLSCVNLFAKPNNTGIPLP